MTVTTTASASVVTAAGEIDASIAERLRERLDLELTVGTRTLIADLSSVTFCSSGGFSALLDTRARAIREDVSFFVVTQQSAVLRPLELLQLDAVLTVYPTLEAVLASK
jgi:anti-sigma B factor antagonist